MSNQLALIQTFDDAERAARAMSASGFFPDSRQAAQAIVKILAGQELGFGPFASMTGVSIIQGKPTIGANLMAAAVKRTGKYNYRVVEMSDAACEIAFFENGQEAGRSRFTIDDAKKANLTGKDNWSKYPRNMLFARALSNGQRWYAPDVFNGALVYTPDELGQSTDEDGNAVIDAVASPAPAPVKVAIPEPPEPLTDADLAHGFTELADHQPEKKFKPALVMPTFPKDLPDLTYERASEVVDSDGAKYIDLESEALCFHAGSILRKNNWRNDDAAGIKLSAIKVILTRRAEEWKAVPAA